MAIAMPMTPICSVIPNSQDSSKRTARVEATDTYMVNFTSPAARSPLLRAPEKGKAMKLINIGFGSMVAAGRILAVVDPDSAPIKRVVQEARDRAMLIDASYGRKTRAVLLMDTDHVILSALTTQALGDRWQGKPDEAAEEDQE